MKNSGSVIKIIISLVCIFTGVYAFFVFFDESGLTSDYDIKFFQVVEKSSQDGSIVITGFFKSNDIISARKSVELHIDSINYNPNKESYPNRTWPNNINVTIYPYNPKESAESWYSQYVDVTLPKTSDVEYYYKSKNLMKEIIFNTSGSQAMAVRSMYFSFNKENVIEIEPYNTYLQLQLNKKMYALTLLGFIVVLIQVYDFVIKQEIISVLKSMIKSFIGLVK